MARRFRQSLSVALALGACFNAVPTAFAAPKDAAALKLDKDAMNNDYLNVNFAGAEAKLRKAIGECGANKCSPRVTAQLQTHLGVILVNAGKVPDGTASFVAALRLDPNAGPEADFASAEVTKAFEDAKRQAGGGAPAPKAPDAPPAAPADSSPSGNLVHTPVTEQVVNTPVPIYAEGEPTVVKMIVQYKSFGASDYSKLDMAKLGKGFGATIPCRDVTAAGTLTYYIVGYDANGEPVDNAGTKKDPYKTQIKDAIAGEAPHLPGKPAPDRCKGASECPPGINQPGCESSKVGTACTNSDDCGGAECREGTCAAADDNSTDDEKSYSKNLVSIDISPDIAHVSGSDLCSRDNQINGKYTCFRSDGGQYSGNPPSGKAGALSGSFALGTVRFMLGYDRLVTPNLGLGARAGFAVGGGPTPDGGNAFVPFHGEARVSYYFGHRPFARAGFRPYVFVNGGLAQVDAKISNVTVQNDCNNKNAPPCTGASPAGAGISVDAWKKLGTTFAGGGLGFMYGFSKNSGLLVDLKGAAYFGSAGFAISPSIGYAQGF